VEESQEKQQVTPLRSGRDDNSVTGKWHQKRSDEWLLMVPQNCHPDRSAAQWRDLLFLFRLSRRLRKSSIDIRERSRELENPLPRTKVRRWHNLGTA
jgi:hypothetical protein